MNKQNSYYDVQIDLDGQIRHYRVVAHSDYHAALKVKHATGFMPKSDGAVHPVTNTIPLHAIWERYASGLYKSPS